MDRANILSLLEETPDEAGLALLSGPTLAILRPILDLGRSPTPPPARVTALAREHLAFLSGLVGACARRLAADAARCPDAAAARIAALAGPAHDALWQLRSALGTPPPELLAQRLALARRLVARGLHGPAEAQCLRLVEAAGQLLPAQR